MLRYSVKAGDKGLSKEVTTLCEASKKFKLFYGVCYRNDLTNQDVYYCILCSAMDSLEEDDSNVDSLIVKHNICGVKFKEGDVLCVTYDQGTKAWYLWYTTTDEVTFGPFLEAHGFKKSGSVGGDIGDTN